MHFSLSLSLSLSLSPVSVTTRICVYISLNSSLIAASVNFITYPGMQPQVTKVLALPNGVCLHNEVNTSFLQADVRRHLNYAIEKKEK